MKDMSCITHSTNISFKLLFKIVKTFLVPFLAAPPKLVLQLSLENAIILLDNLYNLNIMLKLLL
jgi:hypothetical protein